MNDTTPRILKLTNGDNIICMVSKEEENYKISAPLQMTTVKGMGENGPYESLNLTRWVQPYTEERTFDISSNHILLDIDASPGLIVYYEHVLKHIKKYIEIGHETEVKTNKDVYNELLKNAKTDSETIH